MSHALCMMAGFLAATFVHSKALDLTDGPIVGSFIGGAACLIAAAAISVIFGQ